MPRILVCDNIAKAGVEILARSADVVEAGALAPDELAEAVEGCEALLVRSATQVTAEVFERARSLRVVGRAGVGVDNIDVAAATRHGVLVINSPAGNILAAAEHTIALLLAAARNVPQADADMKAGRFNRKKFMGRQIAGKTLGVIGMGKIGTEVARRATSLGMEIIAYDPYAAPDHVQKLGGRSAELPELLAASDFLTVHVPLTNDTARIIGAAELRMLPAHAIVLNCARGGIIDEDALLEALNEGAVAGAALDVFVGEPDVNRELVQHPSVIATPHLGASTSEAQESVAIDAAQQIVDFLAGRPPHSPVNVPALTPEVLAQLAPYLAACTALARLANVLVTRAPRSVSVTASEGAPLAGLPLLASRLMEGMLSGKTDQTINDINALHAARERGVQVTHGLLSEDPGYSTFVQADIGYDDKGSLLAGAVIEGSQSRVLRIDGFSVDVVPRGQLLLVWKANPRVPGFIAQIGSVLAKANVSIEAIQVGREIIDGLGLLLAQVGPGIPAEVREEIRGLSEVVRLEVVSFE